MQVPGRCRCFAVEVCRLGCSGEVEDSYFAQGYRKHQIVLVAARIGYRMEVGLVIGIEDSAGRNSGCVGLAVKEGRVGFAGYRRACARESWRRSSKEDLRRTDLVDHNCFEANRIAQRLMCLVGHSYPVRACGDHGDRDDDLGVRLEDQERTDSVVGRKCSANFDSAVHMAVRLSCAGCPDQFVKNYCSLEHYRYSSVQSLLELAAYAVQQQIRVVPMPDMT